MRTIRLQLLPISEDLAQHDAERIVEHVLSCTRSKLYLEYNRYVDTKHVIEIQQLVSQRITGIPLPYVLGNTYFYKKNFIVSQDVLIPRPETEILIDTVIMHEKKEYCYFIDIGTGSGNVAESLINTMDTWKAVATDISTPALKIARKNCSKRIALLASNRLFSIQKKPIFDFIVSNPPYISKCEMESLDRSVVDFEPYNALCGGVEGLSFYIYLAKNGFCFLKNNGCVYCEIGAHQGEKATNAFSAEGWKDISIYHDLTEKQRVLRAKWLH